MIFFSATQIPFPFFLPVLPVIVLLFIPLGRARAGSLGGQGSAAEGRKGDDED